MNRQNFKEHPCKECLFLATCSSLCKSILKLIGGTQVGPPFICPICNIKISLGMSLKCPVCRYAHKVASEYFKRREEQMKFLMKYGGNFLEDDIYQKKETNESNL